VLGPDGGQGAETTGSLDVANKTNGDHLKSVLVSRWSRVGRSE
jgi:hypothetical protein